MEHRKITEEQAEAVLQILQEECSYAFDLDEGAVFLHALTDSENPCHEWRFMGALGYGGKFRNNGNHYNTPYVDCYPEHLTAERCSMIGRANGRLIMLFKEPGATS